MTFKEDEPSKSGHSGVKSHRSGIGISISKIACVLGADWILTLHSQPIQAFDDLAHWWERHPGCMHNGPAYLLCKLMDAVLDGYSAILERVDEAIESFDEELYNNGTVNRDGESISGEIFKLKRLLLEMRHNAGPTRDVVNVLLRRDSEEGGRHASDFEKLYDHASHVVEKIDSYRELLSGALNACQAIESNRANAAMNRLTVFSIILLPPTLIAGVYGMNFEDMPIKHGFWDSIVFMCAVVGSCALYFKWRKWL